MDYIPSTVGAVYNQWYNLIGLDHTDATKLFTAPKYPGNQYQMKVNLWTSSNTLA